MSGQIIVVADARNVSGNEALARELFLRAIERDGGKFVQTNAPEVVGGKIEDNDVSCFVIAIPSKTSPMVRAARMACRRDGVAGLFVITPHPFCWEVFLELSPMKGRFAPSYTYLLQEIDSLGSLEVWLKRCRSSMRPKTARGSKAALG